MILVKFLEVDGVRVPYHVKNRPVRKARIEVTDRITVILPKDAKEEKLTGQFSKWMLKRYLELKKTFMEMPPKGMQLFGESWKWYKKEKFSIDSVNKTVSLDPQDSAQVKLFKAELKRRLMIKLKKFCQEYSDKYGFSHGKITIRSAKTRWGSCTAKNDLNFSLRLALLKDQLIRSVVYHELIHTIHKNHKKRFHLWLKKEFPESLNKELHKGWVYSEVLFQKLKL